MEFGWIFKFCCGTFDVISKKRIFRLQFEANLRGYLCPKLIKCRTKLILKLLISNLLEWTTLVRQKCEFSLKNVAFLICGRWCDDATCWNRGFSNNWATPIASPFTLNSINSKIWKNAWNSIELDPEFVQNARTKNCSNAIRSFVSYAARRHKNPRFITLVFISDGLLFSFFPIFHQLVCFFVMF